MSRAYDISDFAAFLRKYGDSARGPAARTEEPLRAGHHSGLDRERQQHTSQSRTGDDRFRTTYSDRNRECSLRESEVQTLIELGKIRVVPAHELVPVGYT